ncbi:hypothetical protein ACJJTC_002646 [Scirpophaga incertulas]
MALYTKQDFSPTIFSTKWLAMKLRPNMIVNCKVHIKSILLSGLLFREDSVLVQQEEPTEEEVWRMAGGGFLCFTKGEVAVSLTSVGLCVATFPPRSLQRSTLLKLLLYASVPLIARFSHRRKAGGTLAKLLQVMKSYLTLTQRAIACLKEYAVLKNTIESVSSAIESTATLLIRQLNELMVSMSRASSALLGNVPWLVGDVAWEAVQGRNRKEDLKKIHLAFLVVQSTLLKHIAMAHYVPPAQAQRVYKNYNERLYWLHEVLIDHLVEEFKEKFENLDRMYRLLRNIGDADTSTNKKLGCAIINHWSYSDVHNDVAGASVALKVAASKCNELDIFLDSCAMNHHDAAVNLDGLSKDIEDIIDSINKCMSTLQNSQIRLNKIKARADGVEAEVETVEDDNKNEVEIVQIEDKDPEVKDEVFYFVNTEPEQELHAATDVTTGPGEKEREATKLVLCELKRKLGKREDMMRERERQALVKTMPELKDNIPDFPRQIKFEEFIEWKGYIKKLTKVTQKKKLINIKRKWRSNKKYTSRIEKYAHESDIPEPVYEANEKLNLKRRLISLSLIGHKILITIWQKYIDSTEKNVMSNDLNPESNDPLAHVSVGANTNEPQQNGDGDLKLSEGDFELDSLSESDSDDKERKLALLNDVRRYRAARKKNYPGKRVSIDKSIDKEDESLKPVEYSFGTGMAMASVLQVNKQAKFPSMAQEEVFVGDGEVSEDSGNDE